MLTQQEIDQIRADAEKKYSTGTYFNPLITNAVRQAYTSGRTEEREAAKVLVEALKTIRGSVNKDGMIARICSDAISLYNKEK